MPGLTLKAIDRKVGVQGFGEALCQIGWLYDHPEGVRIANFEEHNGSSAKRRSVDAQRKATVRNVSASDADKTRTEDGQKTPNLGAREEKRREEIEDSVAKATDGAAVDPKETIFSYGVPLLVNAGTSDKHARSFFGGLLKHHAAETIVDVLRECYRAKPLQPIEWLANALPPGGKKAEKKTFAQQNREDAMNRWEEMTGQVHPDRQKNVIDIREIEALRIAQ
ncbi:MAG: hypothetical protein KGL39_23785 [Patescibacteria group bacterium]|nr:hypothetical protein [Patescibacteria group bacterium]